MRIAPAAKLASNTVLCESLGHRAKVGNVRDITPLKIGQQVSRRLLNTFVV